MTSRDLDVLIGLRDIAELAEVRPSAVSNWRKRHEDFPTPRVNAAAGPIFDLREVESWLLAHGKVDRPISPQDVVWRVLDALRGEWRPEQVTSFVISALVFVVAIERAPAIRDSLDSTFWKDTPDSHLLPALRNVATRLEQDHPDLRGLILPGLQEEPAPEAPVVRAVFAALEHAAVNAGPSFFYEAVERMFGFGRFDANIVTPTAVAQLMARLIGPLGTTVVDPACGIGGLLLEAARLSDDRNGDRRLVGYDVNREAVRYARAWLAIFGESGEVQLADTLALASGWKGQHALPAGDSVLLDPPLGRSNWGNAELYAEEYWEYGAPPPRSADFAWLQIALKILRPHGRAAVVLPPGATFHAGREAAIRARMLDAGVVEAVIQLPPRIRRDVSIPLTVWLLEASPSRRRRAVLLIDATSLGTPGRAEHDFHAAAIERVLDAVLLWRSEARVEDEIAIAMSVDGIADAVLFPPRYVERTPELDVESLRRELQSLNAQPASIVVDIPPLAKLEVAASAQRVPLTELVALVRGTYLRDKRDEAYESGGVSVVLPKNVADPAQPLASVSHAVAGQQTRIRAGDLIVALGMPGAPVCEAPSHWVGAILDRRCAHVRVESPRVDPAWVALWARSFDYTKQVAERSIGATMSRISPGDFIAMMVPVPDRESQQRLIDRIRMLDGVISRLEEAKRPLCRRRDLELDIALHSVTDEGSR